MNPSTCSCENGKYLVSIIDDSVLNKVQRDHRCQTVEKRKHITCKSQNFYYLHAFLLIIIALLIAVSIYSYLIKDRAKDNELREFLY